LLIVVLFGFLNIKSVKVYAIPYIFSTTLAHIGYNGFLFPHSSQILSQNLSIGYSTIEAQEAARIGYYVAPMPSPEYECGKRNPLYPIWASVVHTTIRYN
jgi:hypothetical protein